MTHPSGPRPDSTPACTAVIGFLHTSTVQQAAFTAVLADLAPQCGSFHLTDESLLVDARRSPADDDGLRSRVAARVSECAASSDVVLVTCSSIGDVAESLDADARLGVPVLRVDRPVVEQALSLGHRLAIVAAVESTVEPSAALAGSVARSRGVDLDLRIVICAPEAWDAFERLDLERYHGLVADAVDGIDGVDAIVLAQASMAPATTRCTTTIPVLSSPESGVLAAIAAAHDDGGCTTCKDVASERRRSDR